MGSTHLEYQAWESPPLVRVMRVEKSGSLGVLELGKEFATFRRGVYRKYVHPFGVLRNLLLRILDSKKAII